MLTYKTIQGDTWDVIAFRCYGDEHYMSELIAANMAHRYTLIFSAGAVINVPDIEVNTGRGGLPPWKRGASA